MKSTAAMIGANELSAQAKELEFAARDKRFDIIYEKTEGFVAYWRTFDEKLSAVVSEEEDTQEISDADELIKLTNAIRAAMEEFDVDTADECVAKLKGYTYSTDVQKNAFNELALGVSNLETEEMDRLCDAFIDSLK